MATSSTSGLKENKDFAADLLLNKIMNGQYRAESGKTITLGGRINALNLDSESRQNALTAENVAKAAVDVDTTQDRLNEMANLAERVKDAVSTTTDTDTLKRLGAEFLSEITAYESGFSTGTVVDLGLGSGSATVGGVTPSDIAGYAAFTGALSTMSASGASVAATDIEAALKGLYAEITVMAAQGNLVHNRYDVLNDLASSYHRASDDQAVEVGGNATSLLNALL